MKRQTTQGACLCNYFAFTNNLTLITYSIQLDRFLLRESDHFITTVCITGKHFLHKANVVVLKIFHFTKCFITLVFVKKHTRTDPGLYAEDTALTMNEVWTTVNRHHNITGDYKMLTSVHTRDTGWFVCSYVSEASTAYTLRVTKLF